MNRLVITEEPDVELAAELQASQLVVDTDLSPELREVAVQFFNPMVHALMKDRTLCLSPHWRRHLDAARSRLLDRVALALGGIIVAPQHGPAGVGQAQNGTPAAPRSAVASHKGQPEALKGKQGASLPYPYPRAKSEAPRAGASPGPLPVLTLRPDAPAAGQLAGALGAARLCAPRDAPGVGAWRTDGRTILIVGDRPNGEQHAAIKQRIPFFSMHQGGCSLWLAQQLEDAGIPEDRLYWINAYSWDGKPTNGDFVKVMKPCEVIALGQNAHLWCVNYADTIPFMAEHPSYWKRFGANRPYSFIEHLRDLTVQHKEEVE